MQEQEQALRALLIQPAFGDRFRLGAVALPRSERQLRRVRRHLVVEEIESLVDAGFLAEHVRRHDAAGRVAALAQHLRQEPLAAFHGEPDVVADAGLERQPSRQERGVRRQRLRRMGIGPLEDDAVGRERVDRRRLHVAVAVDGQVVGSQRVDGDEDDRAVDRRGRAGVAPSASGSQSCRQRGGNQDERVSKGARHRIRWTTGYLSCSTAVFAWAASGDVGSIAITCVMAFMRGLFVALVHRDRARA